MSRAFTVREDVVQKLFEGLDSDPNYNILSWRELFPASRHKLIKASNLRQGEELYTM